MIARRREPAAGAPARLPARAGPAQLLGRRSAGREGTHGAFRRRDLACAPFYHSPMPGPRGIARPSAESELNPFRRRLEPIEPLPHSKAGS